jgi:hypothetical protein
LNSREHATLKLRAAPAQPPHFLQVLAPEFAAAALCCPVLFTKDTNDGRFFAGAMFGFKPGENFIGATDQPGAFDPLVMRREGFFLSGQQIAIDRDHARFSETDGEPLFDAAGEPAAALRAIQKTLGDIHGGMELTRAFIAEMTELKLIEPINVSLTFTDGERLTLEGLYTVSLDRLRDVDDIAALRLFRSGHLQLVYIMAGSLRHLPRLARLRDQRE